MTSYADVPTGHVSGGNGVDYAYRETGSGDVPLVLLQHFRGNLDNWDPALVDALAGGWWRSTTQASAGPTARLRTRSPRWPATRLPSSTPSTCSYLLAGLIPHARVKIYPDSAHGFLFQHHTEFAADIDTFLTEPQK